MKSSDFMVRIRQEPSPAGQWAVELLKMGGCYELKRFPRERRDLAQNCAREFSEFTEIPLGQPVVREEEVKNDGPAESLPVGGCQ
jgi:hypothetical protein